MNLHWELLILHDLPPAVELKPKLSSLAVGELDGDGHMEMVIGGQGALFWYRSSTFERGTIAEGHFCPGLALEDVDGDGNLEVVTGCAHLLTSVWMLAWFKAGRDLHEPWTRYVLDPSCNGGAHDLLFVDLDGDGERELVANAMYCDVPGIFAYKGEADPALPWQPPISMATARSRSLTGLPGTPLRPEDLTLDVGTGRCTLLHSVRCAV